MTRFKSVLSKKQSFTVNGLKYRFHDWFFETDEKAVIVFLEKNQFAEKVGGEKTETKVTHESR